MERAIDSSEFLALDNLLLARRAAEAEQQLERERRRASGGGTSIMGSLLLGYSSAKEQQELDAAAELRARADENVQLQHALFEQQRESQAALRAQAVRGGAYLSLLTRALGEVEVEMQIGRAAATSLARCSRRSSVADRH